MSNIVYLELEKKVWDLKQFFIVFILKCVCFEILVVKLTPDT